MPVLPVVTKIIPHPRIKLSSLCALVFSLCSTQAMAASVVLDNGDQISGEVIKLGDNILTFKSPLFGEIEVP